MTIPFKRGGLIAMNEYCQGFEDALDLVQYRIQDHKLLSGKIKNELENKYVVDY